MNPPRLCVALLVTWLATACSSSPTGTTPVPPTAIPVTAESGPAPSSTVTQSPPDPEPSPSEQLSFEVDAPHLQGAVAQSHLPDEVKETVTQVLDGKKVDAEALARAKRAVSPELGDVLTAVAEGKTVREAMANSSGVAVVRSIDPDTADRWLDFSRQSEQVEVNLLAFLTAFNARDPEALIRTLALPFYTDTIARKTPDEVKAVFVQYWQGMGTRGESTVRGKKCTHMPHEAFAHAAKLGSMTIDDPIRSYVPKVLEGHPGYVSLCEFAIEAKDGSVLSQDRATFVSRKKDGKYLIVAMHRR